MPNVLEAAAGGFNWKLVPLHRWFRYDTPTVIIFEVTADAAVGEASWPVLGEVFRSKSGVASSPILATAEGLTAVAQMA